jgi:hypothetical protein
MSFPDPHVYATHQVSNQPPPLADYDAYGSDPVLQSVVQIFGADWARDRLHVTGRTVGSAHVQELARQANRHLPELRTHDRFGHRVDRVDFHSRKPTRSAGPIRGGVRRSRARRCPTCGIRAKTGFVAR